jgi:hypothetical protein
MLSAGLQSIPKNLVNSNPGISPSRIYLNSSATSFAFRVFTLKPMILFQFPRKFEALSFLGFFEGDFSLMVVFPMSQLFFALEELYLSQTILRLLQTIKRAQALPVLSVDPPLILAR